MLSEEIRGDLRPNTEHQLLTFTGRLYGFAGELAHICNGALNSGAVIIAARCPQGDAALRY